MTSALFQATALRDQLYRSVRIIGPPAFGLAVLLLCWWAYAKTCNSILIPGPSDVAGSLLTRLPAIVSGALIPTLKRVALGFVIGVVAGFIGGILVSLNHFIYRVCIPYIEFFRSLPVTALFPFFLTLLGDNEYSRAVTIVYMAFWIAVFNISHAMLRVRGGRQMYLATIKAPRLFVVRHLYLYELAYPLLNTVRITLSLSLLVIVGIEMVIGAPGGLGTEIFNAHYLFDYPGMLATILVVGFTGLALNFFAARLESFVLYWREA